LPTASPTWLRVSVKIVSLPVPAAAEAEVIASTR
jgi:hypothetical protein